MSQRIDQRFPGAPADGEVIEIIDGDESSGRPGDPGAAGAPPRGTRPEAPVAFFAQVDSEGGDLLALVSSPPAPPSPEPSETPAGEVDRLMATARDLVALGNFTGALEATERVLALAPGHPEARDHHARTEETLLQMYESKLGHLSRTPRVLLPPDELVWLGLDHRAGFVLAQIDGQVTLEDVFALSGMSRLDTAKILVELLEQGAIAS